MRLESPPDRGRKMALKEIFSPIKVLVLIFGILLFSLTLILSKAVRAYDSGATLAPEPAYQADVPVEKEKLAREIAELRKKSAELELAIKRLSKKIEPLATERGQTKADAAASDTAPPYGSRLTLSAYKLPKKVIFAGKEVPLDKWDVKERLEWEFYTVLGDEKRLILLLKKNKRYFPIIEKQLRESGLPLDLKYVAVVESALSEKAYSSAGAVGVWQFIRGTGHRYGLDQTRWKDERRDLERATASAIAYLKQLYSRFGDWPLALAAYNAGEAKVEKELAEQKVTNYYQLALPLETERYVFKIIATKLIFSEPEKYGLAMGEEDYFLPKHVEKVKIKVAGGNMHLSEVAAAAGSYFREIKLLNPDLLKDYLPPGEHDIFIPKAGAERFLQNFKDAKAKSLFADSSKNKRWPADGKRINYVVKKGDTLWGIAARYDVELSQLLKWNRLDKKAKIQPGERLVLYR